MSIDKTLIKLNDYATNEYDEEKKEVLESAAKIVNALLALPEEVNNQISLVTCNDNSCQKWFELGERHIQNSVEIAIREVEK